MVIKKINNLRSAYRKEIKKIKASVKSGAAGDSVYQPKLWYFNLLRFLDDPDTPRISYSNVDSSDDDTSDTQGQTQDDTSQESINSESIAAFETGGQEENFSEPSVASSSNEPTPRRNKTNKKRVLETEQDSLTKDVLQTVKTHFKKPEDRFDVVGKMIAMKLRSLPKDQMLIAEKIINETLFEAEMGKLTLFHRLVSQPALSQSQQTFPQYQSPTPSTTFSHGYACTSHSSILSPPGLQRPVYQQPQLQYHQENSLQSCDYDDSVQPAGSAASLVTNFQG